MEDIQIAVITERAQVWRALPFADVCFEVFVNNNSKKKKKTTQFSLAYQNNLSNDIMQ